MNERKRWFVVVVFAIAMAWVESAVVFYLRTMINRIEPYQVNPLPVFGGLAKAELIREFATLVMLFTVGMLAGKSWRSRLGYAAIAFGIWDIFYYLFLKVICAWPSSLLDWDILFLLPLPWWGPVLAPVSIAILMILWGTLASQVEQLRQSLVSSAIPWTLNFIGTFIALYVFMADALRVSTKGETALRTLLPTKFNWALFGVALLLMAAPLASELRQIFGKRIFLSHRGQNKEGFTAEKE
jgi:hypothetical protein